MPVLLVAHQLNNDAHDYAPLYEAIKTNANGWVHHITDAWIVNTALSANDFAHKLLPFILKSDRLLVVRITAEYQGWLPQEAWDWLNKAHY